MISGSRNIPESHLNSKISSKSKHPKEHSRHNDRASDTKTIKVSDKRSQKQPIIGTRSNINSSNMRGESKCYSQIDCKSETNNFIQNVNEDNKTQNDKSGSNSINIHIDDDLQREELIRDGLMQQTALRSSDTGKIKIGTKYRKLVDTNHINKKSQESSGDPEVARKEQNEYQEIANDVKLDNLQSKVVVQVPTNSAQNTLQSKIMIDIPGLQPNKDHVLYKLVEEESLMVPTPRQKGQSSCFVAPPQEFDQKGIEQNSSLMKITEKKQQNMQNKSFLNIDSEQQAQINDSVNRQFAQVVQQVVPSISATRQVQLDLTISQTGVHFEQKIKATKPKNQQGKLQKTKNMQLLSHTLYYKISDEKEEQSPKPEHLQSQIVELNKTVKELRLQKIKATASKRYFQESQIRFGHSEAKSNPLQQQTIIDSLNSSQAGQISSSISYQPIYFGRIRKNRSANKPVLQNYVVLDSCQIEESKDVPIIFSKLKYKNSDKGFRSVHSQRRKDFRYGQRQSHKGNQTVDLRKITEQMEKDSIRNINLNKSKELNKPQNKMRTGICQKIMNKFDSDDKKFQKFLIREQTKSRQLHQRLSEKKKGKEGSLRRSTKLSQQREQSPIFEGSIIKNIIKPHYQSNKFKQNSLPFLDENILAMIAHSEKKQSIKKVIAFTKLKIPQFPTPPTPSTSTQQLMENILKMLPYSNEMYEDQLNGCSLRKYKNCVMFQLPERRNFKVVWHYSGKIYVGGWDPIKNQKSGQGFEYHPSKYYYKGSYSSNKKYGRGILLHLNGSIYEGDFIDGEKHGRGKYFDSINNIFYEGGWANGKMEGHGYMEFESDIYEGEFKEDQKSGYGVQHFGSGDRYCGQYAQDKFNGQGKYIWTDGAQYVGNFRQNYRHDYGKWTSAGKNPETYIGFYTKGKRHGSGKYIWGNGCTYDGHFQEDLKHGMGTMQYPDGRWMEGVWTQGLLTTVLSKLTEANYEEPLEEPKNRGYQTHIRIKVLQKEQSP